MNKHFSCSVVIPARNEAGNIEETVDRVPTLGRGTEIIVVEGGSQDHTWEVLQRVSRRRPELKILKQTGQGKAAAVRNGFEQAQGELLCVLDADLTVAPEELHRFYAIAQSGAADFINGVRCFSANDPAAMPVMNRIANRLFSTAFSCLFRQRIQDTLCGTKVLFRADYLAMAQRWPVFGSSDPFGDFDLLLGAAELKLRVLDLPVRYRSRSYGQSNIRRWQDGYQLVRAFLAGAVRLKRHGYVS